MTKKTENKQKPIIFIGTCGTFPYDFVFTIGKKPKQVEDFILKQTGYVLDEDERKSCTLDRGAGRTTQFKNRAFLIQVKDRYIPTINHEILHLVVMAMDSAGVRLCDASDEAFAYLMGYVSRQIYRKLGNLYA